MAWGLMSLFFVAAAFKSWIISKKNVQKRKAAKRSIAKPGDDHDLGLCIDYELLRKHQEAVANRALGAVQPRLGVGSVV